MALAAHNFAKEVTTLRRHSISLVESRGFAFLRAENVIGALRISKDGNARIFDIISGAQLR